MSEDIQLSKDIKLNSKALMKNLEDTEAKLRAGALVGDAFNEADIIWLNLSQEKRDEYRDQLTPRPTREYTRKLTRLHEKYTKIQNNSDQDKGS